MSIADVLERCRVTLDDVDFRDVHPGNVMDPNDVKGRITEEMVRLWLDSCPEVIIDRDFPRDVHGYHLERDYQGVKIHRGDRRGRTEAEFDYVVYHGRTAYVVQVKSLHLNGLEGRIDSDLNLAQVLFPGYEVGELLFFPYYANKQDFADRMACDHPGVVCMDLGYKRKQLMQTIRDYYNSRRIRMPSLGIAGD